jgi:CspA family cold shock protein
MARGTVKTLVRERGFGFIHRQGAVELFFHKSAFHGGGFDSLTEGQAVEFDVERGDKGPRAANMKVSPPSV